MGQVTIYLDAETEKKMRAAAKAMHISQSKWIAGIIREKTADEWPDDIRKLAGAWQSLDDIDNACVQMGEDIPREDL